MKQINFRLTDEEYQFIEELAKVLGKSVPSLLKELSMKEIDTIRIKMALELYADNKIGLKKAWKLSNLPFIKFLEQLQERDIEPNIPNELDEKMVNLALNLKMDEIFSNKSKEDLKKLVYSSHSSTN
ncbi:MAG: UPF0175 family protein [Candidatus Helarchaeota archaeon]